jgi:hypothetical protein
MDPLPFLDCIRARRGLARLKAIADQNKDDDAERLQRIESAVAQMGQTVAWMARRMHDADSTSQFLIRENELLRGRRAERMQFVSTMHTQQQAGIIKQLTNLTQQQASIIDALSAFSISFHQPPPSVDDAIFDPTINEILA